MEEESKPQSHPPQAPPRRSPEETLYNKFNKLKTEAYILTNAAMALDEERKKEEAFKAYQEALEIIDKAILVAHSGGFPPNEVDKVEEIVYKMRITRKEVLERVSDLQHISAAITDPESTSSTSYLDGPSNIPTVSLIQEHSSSTRSPPPYSLGEYEDRRESAGNLYGQLSGHLEEIALEQASLRNPLPINAQEVFNIADNIQIYFIGPDDNVLAPSYPSFLRIVVLNSDAQVITQPQLQQPPAFLQVGDWTYPLIQGQSPIFYSSDGSYIFPDLVSGNEGANVGLILPPEISMEQKKSFEDILLQLIGLEALPGIPTTTQDTTSIVKDPREGHKGKHLGDKSISPHLPESTSSTRISTRIAEGLISGAETVAQGLIVGAEKTSELLNKGTHYVIGKIHPVEEKPKISSDVKSYVKTAKTITGHTVQISGYLVSQLGRATVHLGRKVAPYVQSTTARLYAKTTNSSEADTQHKMGQVWEVSGGALVGFGTVYLGLEHAAKVLASSLANNTVRVVNHRYGHEAGCLADDAASTVGNTVVTGLNCRCLGPKAMAKRVVKDAGKASLVPPNKPDIPK